MKFNFLKVIVTSLIILSSSANAGLITESTGDLGNNVISDAGLYDVYLNASTPSNSLSAGIQIEYGLWNSPNVNVSVFFNDTLLGSLLADSGYISPGSEFIDFDITGLLVDGLNKISFNGFGANSGDYVIGKVDMSYDNSGAVSVPTPSTIAIFALGMMILSSRQLKKQS